MVTYTPILKLAQPVFDQDPWDTDINGDMAIIDGVLGRFFAIPNFVGMWRNATSYVSGQAVVDSTDSSMWQCVVSHTSAALPATFADDRAAFPSYWVNTVSGINDLVDAAAASAAAADASADAAAASAAAAANKVPLAGGTMTGPLVLSANPTLPLGAATKQYVDGVTGGVGFLPLSGGTLTGLLTLSGNPTLPLHAVPKQYSDAIYLPKTGGTISGTLTVSTPTLPLHAATKGYVDTNVGAYLPLAGGTVAGNLNASSGRILSYNAANAPCVVMQDTTSIVAGSYVVGSTLRIAQFSGALSPVADWAVFSGTGTSVIGALDASGPVTGVGGVYAYNVNFGMFQDSTYRWQLFGATTYGWRWDLATGDMTWISNNFTTLYIRTSDKLLINSQAGVSALGPYTNLSDVRSKRAVEPVKYGLAEILRLQPVSFHRVTHDDRSPREIGFVAQDVMKEVPEAVNVVGIPLPDGTGGVDSDDPTRGVAVEMLFAVAVNAIKELTTRIVKLEAAK